MESLAREMMKELDAIAAERGIVWTGAEVIGAATSVRTRYATPGQRCGNGTVRHLSDKQVWFIKALLASRDTRNLVRLPGSEDIEHMSLRGASDLIERLLGCPELPAAKRPAEPLATEKQVSYLRSLATRKGYDFMNELGIDVTQLPKSRASKVIDHLTRLPDAAQSPAETVESPAAPATGGKVDQDGMYRNPTTGEIFKVQKAVHGSGHLYAKRLVVTIDGRDVTSIPLSGEARDATGRFEMARGAIFRIRPEWRMSIEEAKAFGSLYGVCVRCAATLTDETSIERAMGPVCAGKI